MEGAVASSEEKEEEAGGGPQILLPGLNGRLANVRVRGGENECAQT